MGVSKWVVESLPKLNSVPVSKAKDQIQNSNLVTSEKKMQDCEDNNVFETKEDIFDIINSEFEIELDFKKKKKRRERC